MEREMKKTLVLLAMALPTLVMGETIEGLNKKFNALAAEMQKIKESKSKSAFDKFSIGGYGELIYTNMSSEDESGDKVGSDSIAKSDTLRHVIVMGYQFNEKWKLVSEVEIEHAKEIYTEFLYLDYSHNQFFNFSAGLLPAPVGILNLVHEPPTFYSVSRPEVENKMIPTTWREHGAGVHGAISDFQYGFYAMNSLNGSAFTDSSVRSGRQKGSKSVAENQSVVARIDWRGPVGLILGGSAYVGELNGVSGAKHSIYEAHGEWKYSGLRLRALYAQALIDADKINQQEGYTGESSVGEKQEGGYIEAGYDVLNSKEDALVLFGRYEILDTQKEVPTGFSKDKGNNKTNITFGVNYRPIEQIVFKADYMIAKNEAKTGADSFNLGIGWQF